VPAAFADLLAALTAAYIDVCGGSGSSRLVGVYLRGSLPQGLFLRGISDVDTYALLLPLAPAGAGAAASSDGLQPLQHALQQRTERLISQHKQDLGYTKVCPLWVVCARCVHTSTCRTAVRAWLSCCWAGCSRLAHTRAPHLVQVEVKLLQVQLGTAAAAALAQLITHQHEQHDRGRGGSSSSSSTGGSQQHTCLRPSMCPDIPAAFELKAQSVCLAGVDLPALLPRCAALPPLYSTLPGLAEGVAAAREAGAAADARLTLQGAGARTAQHDGPGGWRAALCAGRGRGGSSVQHVYSLTADHADTPRDVPAPAQCLPRAGA
jgi:hypothetical protein